MKLIRFETTCHSSVQGSKHKDNFHKTMWVEIPAPENVMEMWKDGYSLTRYIEQTTNLFVFRQTVIERNEDLLNAKEELPEIKEFNETYNDDKKLAIKLHRLFGKDWFNPWLDKTHENEGLSYGRLNKLIENGYLLYQGDEQTKTSDRKYKVVNINT